VILADTSVWIDYLNGKNTSKTDLLDASLEHGLLIMGDLILLEILQGIRDDKQYRLVKSELSKLEIFQLLQPDLVNNCAEYYRKLRKKGITIRKTADVIIASFCINRKIPLLFSDKDLVPFVKHLKLLTLD
jgi:predicted nucleic acid-binding protein